MGQEKAKMGILGGQKWNIRARSGILGGKNGASKGKNNCNIQNNPSNISQYKIVTCSVTSVTGVHIRAGPQSQNWSDQQNTLDPTGSVHKKARGKKFDPKKVDFDEGDCT